MSTSPETPPQASSSALPRPPPPGTLTNRAGGLDSMQFADLLSTIFEKKDSKALSIGFRECDFSYFAVESWSPRFTPKCVTFQGEIPFLYVIQHPGSSTGLPTAVPPDFFTLVDYVAQTTGSGLGIQIDGKVTATNLRTDLRTGLRVRYLLTPLPPNDDDVSTFYWVERTQSGRGGSYRTVSAQRRKPGP